MTQNEIQTVDDEKSIAGLENQLRALVEGVGLLRAIAALRILAHKIQRNNDKQLQDAGL